MDSKPTTPDVRHAHPTARAGHAPRPDEWYPGDNDDRRPPPDLRELLRIARRNAWLIILTVLVSTGWAAYTASQEKPRYRAGATLRMEHRREALAGQFDRGYVDWLAWRTNPLITESILLRENRGVGGAVVDREGLRLQIRSEGFTWAFLEDVAVAPEVEPQSFQVRFTPGGLLLVGADGRREAADYGAPVEIDGVRFTVTREPDVESATLGVVTRDQAIAAVLGALEATAREETNLIDLQYTSWDARLAQLVVNAVAEEFQEDNFDRLRQISVQRRAFIGEQIDEMQTLLTEAYRTLADFRHRRQLYGDLDGRQEDLLDLDIRREELVSDRDMVQAAMDDYRSREEASGDWIWSLMVLPGVESNRIMASLYGELTGYQDERQQMVAGEWGTWPGHPDVQRLDGLIASTEQKMMEALTHHVSGLNARIAALDQLRDRRLQSLDELASSEMEEIWLMHEVETIRGIAEQLRVEYQRARISEAVETPQWGVMSRATGPGYPLGTGERKAILWGLVLGLMVGGGASYVRENLDGSIRRREEIQSVFGVPGLAVIPRITPSRNRRGNEPTLDLATTSDLHSVSAEAYRILRTNLIFSHAVHQINTLLVTSASEGEGKTTTAANLAVAASQQQDLRVLLIDCDLRKARLHNMFDVPKYPGLTDFLIRTHSITDVVHPTSVPGLHLIPAGTSPPNAADLLGIDRMGELLETLKEKVDLIILDSPPVLAAADSMILSLQVDGTLLVARAGKTDRATARHGMQQITSVGGRVVGVVLNDPDEKVKKYYYYYSKEGHPAEERRRDADSAPVPEA